MLKVLLGNSKSVVKLESFYSIWNFRRNLRYSTSTKVDPSAVANYLVESLGFSEQQSVSISTKIVCNQVRENSTFAANANSVVNFFNQVGYDDAQIRKIVSCYPRILNANVDKTLIPKFKLIEEAGFSGSDVAEIMVANPSLLYAGLESRILPAIVALREVLRCDADVISVLKEPHWSILGCVSKYLVSNVNFLRSYGVPFEGIRKRLLGPRAAFLREPEAFANVVIQVDEKLGISRDTGLFLTAVEAISHLSEDTFELKCNAFKSFGWTQSDILKLIKANPRCLGLSEGRIKRALCFLMKELHYKPAYLASYHNLLTSSMEKRILPRYRVLTVLKEKGLVSENYPLNSAVVMTEPVFLKKFVLPFEDVHEIYSKHTRSSVKMLNATVEE